MRRKIVQHGPGTLTISLPARWVKEQGLGKGAELVLEEVNQGLLLTATHGVRMGEKRVNVHSLSPFFLERVVAAMYKRGYDELLLEYANAQQLEIVHAVLNKGCIGWEIVDDTGTEIRIRTVSEPSSEEFRALFRRLFYFLLSVAQDTGEAVKRHDRELYQKIVLRDENVNRLSDFCRRLVNKRSQHEYQSDVLLYHIIEQLEKIGDDFKTLNIFLAEQARPMSKGFLTALQQAVALLRLYEDVFFRFTLEKADQLLLECRSFLAGQEKDAGEGRAHPLLSGIVREIYNLLGATVALHA
jgi:phosphate uptake regulator